jgi:hypothetical protein
MANDFDKASTKNSGADLDRQRDQPGNSFSNSCGTDCRGLSTSTPAATATKPSSAIRPSRKEYARSRAALRRITPRFRVDSTPVTEWGYLNSARAEPSASDM